MVAPLLVLVALVVIAAGVRRAFAHAPRPVHHAHRTLALWAVLFAGSLVCWWWAAHV